VILPDIPARHAGIWLLFALRHCRPVCRYTAVFTVQCRLPTNATEQGTRMTPLLFSRCNVALSLSLALMFHAVLAGAQSPAPAAQDYTPSPYQAGKDVVWVPTPGDLVEKMLDMARITPADLLLDLGSGDGRTVIAAARRGATAMGIEYNPDMVALSRREALKAGVAARATFVQGDIFQSDISKATVISLFLLPELNLRLRPGILALKPGTRVVSNTFRMGDWSPDEAADLKCGPHCIAYLWIVPARVEGRWQSTLGPLAITQNFQTFEGAIGGKPTDKGRLQGERIYFSADGMEFAGVVRGDSMEGSFQSASGASGIWKATR
jgi:SAM-dependent methyltransferase